MMTKKEMGSCSSKANDRVDPRIGIIIHIPSKYSSSVSETEDSNSSTTNNTIVNAEVAPSYNNIMYNCGFNYEGEGEEVIPMKLIKVDHRGSVVDCKNNEDDTWDGEDVNDHMLSAYCSLDNQMSYKEEEEKVTLQDLENMKEMIYDIRQDPNLLYDLSPMYLQGQEGAAVHTVLSLIGYRSPAMPSKTNRNRD